MAKLNELFIEVDGWLHNSEWKRCELLLVETDPNTESETYCLGVLTILRPEKGRFLKEYNKLLERLRKVLMERYGNDVDIYLYGLE